MSAQVDRDARRPYIKVWDDPTGSMPPHYKLSGSTEPYSDEWWRKRARLIQRYRHAKQFLTGIGYDAMCHYAELLNTVYYDGEHWASYY